MGKLSIRAGVFLLMGAAATSAGTCAGGGDVASDRGNWWDTDRDTISTYVELYHTNQALYHFDTTRFDHNPSVAFGTPGNGTLTGSLNLPYYERVPGAYWTYTPGTDPIWDHPDSNDWGTLSLINMIEATGRAWAARDQNDNTCWLYSLSGDGRYYPYVFHVGDLSKFGGGLWLDFDGSHRHDDHQNGTDADFRYLRKDGADQYLYIDQTPDQYDTLATADLFRCIIEHGNVSYILVDSADLGFSIPGYTMNYPGHNTHFHVTIDRP